jgi:hypothetical protein
VQRYLERAMPATDPVPTHVRVGQLGEMWQKPGGRALRFSAVEEFAVEEVAFSWQARFPILPFVSLRVVDSYAAEDGFLAARLFGLLPLMRQQGAEVSRGEAMRYLAELPWVPHAIRSNRQLGWHQLDDRSVEVSTSVRGASVAVRLDFDASGDIVGTFAGARPHLEGKTSVPRPWVGEFSDYTHIGAVRLPSRGEVRWILPDGPFTYWRGEITSLELLHDAGANESRRDG